jgi:cAMP-regulated phosphoprotein/endosulfine conserved region
MTPQSLSADEQRLFRLYGKLPNKKDLLQNKLKERKYFDSGDYALSKAGKASDSGVTSIGTQHPQAADILQMSPLTNTLSRGDSMSGSPGSGGLGGLNNDPNNPMLPGAGLHRGSIQGIPGLNAPGGGMGGPMMQMQTSRSPVKESSFLARQASWESASEEKREAQAAMEGSVSPPTKKEGIPIRRG